MSWQDESNSSNQTTKSIYSRLWYNYFWLTGSCQSNCRFQTLILHIFRWSPKHVTNYGFLDLPYSTLLRPVTHYMLYWMGFRVFTFWHHFSLLMLHDHLATMSAQNKLARSLSLYPERVVRSYSHFLILKISIVSIFDWQIYLIRLARVFFT